MHSNLVRPRYRIDAVKVLEARIERAYRPRTSAFFIALISSLFGVLFSAVLWHLGLESMTWRYPVAMLLSYLVLLGLLWIWSRRDLWDGSFDFGSGNGGGSGSHGSSYNDASGYSGGGGEFGGAGASGSFDAGATGAGADSSVVSELASGAVQASVSADESVIVLLPLALAFALILVFGGLAASAVSLVWQAPSLLAELMIDAGTAGLLAVFVRHQDRRGWLATALRRTLPVFVGLTLVFSVAGYAMEWIDPTAITLFDVLDNRAWVSQPR